MSFYRCCRVWSMLTLGKCRNFHWYTKYFMCHFDRHILWQWHHWWSLWHFLPSFNLIASLPEDLSSTLRKNTPGKVLIDIAGNHLDCDCNLSFVKMQVVSSGSNANRTGISFSDFNVKVQITNQSITNETTRRSIFGSDVMTLILISALTALRIIS